MEIIFLFHTARKWKSWGTTPAVGLLSIILRCLHRIAILYVQDFDGIVSGEKYFVYDVNFLRMVLYFFFRATDNP